MSKARIAAELGRNGKTIDRLVSDLRRRGIIEITPSFDACGAQLANAYRVVDADALAAAVRGGD